MRALTGLLVLLVLAPAHASSVRPFTVQDSIEWQHVLSFSAETGHRTKRVALFSPDGSQFVLHTRRGDLRRNVNVESLLLFNTREVREYARRAQESDAPEPLKLAALDAAKDEDLVTGIRWLDNAQVGFIAKAPEGRMQAFAVEVGGRSLTRLTASETDVVGFGGAGRTLAYYACIPHVPSRPLTVVVESFDDTSPVAETSASACYSGNPIELFARTEDRGVRRLPLPAMVLYPDLKRIWPAPSGKYAVILAPAVNAPASWAEYQGPATERFGFTSQWVRDDPTSLDLLSRTRYLLVDLTNDTIRPLLDAPTGQMSLNYTPLEVFWRSDSRSVIVSNTYLPLTGVSETERSLRLARPAVAEVDIVSGKVTTISWEDVRSEIYTRVPNPIVDFAWDPTSDRLTLVHERAADGVVSRETYVRRTGGWSRSPSRGATGNEISIVEEQGLNERPKIYVSAGDSARRRMLFDPNPQAEHLILAKTQVIHWRDGNGVEWTGGLLLPTSYVGGNRYPLVVQTHGFVPWRFLLDGPTDGTGAGTAFAAQAMANAGFVVLQVEDNRQTITEDQREGPAIAEGFRAAIDKLIEDGLVDRTKVGLTAFSRTGWPALHLISRYPTMLAALQMSDTLNVGYLPLSYHVGNPQMVAELTKLTGGKPTISAIGDWFASNPLYASPRASAAIRLEGMGTGAGMWEMYALLRDANRPVEFVLYPDGSHSLEKPDERLSSQGGSVDWFRFWLQGFADSDPAKQEQYTRWRRLRDLGPP
jgi:dipeptidyl aminopeptidase/acylaminoacyl peptidase